jgi:hypothetical protein
MALKGYKFSTVEGQRIWTQSSGFFGRNLGG